MPTPDPRKPGDAPAATREDEHGGKLAKFFRDLEQDEPVGALEPQPDKQPADIGWTEPNRN